MKVTNLLIILILIAGTFLYFSQPRSTGPELQFKQDLFLDLPQDQTDELLIPNPMDFRPEQVISIRTQKHLGSFLLDQGLLRWIEEQDFAGINQQWMTSYGYQEPRPELLSTTTNRVIQMDPEWFPFILPSWVGAINSHGNSIRFGKNPEVIDSFQSWSWASVISSMDGNRSYFAVSLVDGRIVVFSNISGDLDSPILLEPRDEWFRNGRFAQRIPITISFVNDFLVTVYGSLAPRAVLWDTQTWEPVQQFDISNIDYPQNLRIRGFENQQGELRVDFSDGHGSFQVSFSPLDGTVRRNESRGSLIGFLPALNLALYDSLIGDPSPSRFQFFRATDTGNRVLQTMPFAGSITPHQGGVLWFGQEVYGQVSIYWAGTQDGLTEMGLSDE